MRPLLDPSYFHARLLSPKDSHHDYSIPFVSAEVPFRNENGQKMGRDLLSFPTKKALTPEGSHVRRGRQKGGRIYEPSEENADRTL